MKKIVIYSCTTNLLPDVKVSVNSLLRNNQIDEVRVLTNCSELVGFPDAVRCIDASEYMDIFKDSVNKNTRWTVMSLMRLALPDIFDDDLVLYLDCDIIVDSEITELWDIDMSDYYIAGVQEYTHMDEYINAGVILMNLQKMRQDKVTSRLIQLANEEQHCFPDQDIINKVCCGRIKFLDAIYNANDWTGIPKDTKIRHYAGQNPYHDKDLWLKYL